MFSYKRAQVNGARNRVGKLMVIPHLPMLVYTDNRDIFPFTINNSFADFISQDICRLCLCLNYSIFLNTFYRTHQMIFSTA